MIDTHIYDYDTYSRDTEMSTYLCAELVMSDIDAYLRDRSNLALDSDMVIPRLLERNILDVLVLPRFVRPRFARRPCPSGLVHRASSMSKQKLNPCELSQGFLL